MTVVPHGQHNQTEQKKENMYPSVSYRVSGLSPQGTQVRGEFSFDCDDYPDGNVPTEHVYRALDRWANFEHNVQYLSLVALDQGDNPVACLMRNPVDMALTRALLSMVHRRLPRLDEEGLGLYSELFDWARRHGVTL